MHAFVTSKITNKCFHILIFVKMEIEHLVEAGEEVPVWAFGIPKLYIGNSFVYGYVKPSDLDSTSSRHSSTLANHIKR